MQFPINKKDKKYLNIIFFLIFSKIIIVLHLNLNFLFIVKEGFCKLLRLEKRNQNNFIRLLSHGSKKRKNCFQKCVGGTATYTPALFHFGV